MDGWPSRVKQICEAIKGGGKSARFLLSLTETYKSARLCCGLGERHNEVVAVSFECHAAVCRRQSSQLPSLRASISRRGLRAHGGDVQTRERWLCRRQVPK